MQGSERDAKTCECLAPKLSKERGHKGSLERRSRSWRRSATAARPTKLAAEAPGRQR
jgi:hypothetical protein